MTTTSGKARPVDAGIFASLDPPRLAASRCTACGTVVFPAASGCPRCSGSEMAGIELPATGVLWSWTVQHFEPKPPYVPSADGFSPYGVGYVDLGAVLVESRLVGSADDFAVGAPMRLVLLPLPPAPGEVDPVVTYAFAPERAETQNGADA